MQIILSPQRRDARLTLARNGDVLTINGQDFNFGPVTEGAILPVAAVQSDWIAGDITRIGGVLQIPVFLPHGANAPHATLYPAPLLVVADGAIPLPAYETEITP